jgi:4-amino-4-deoxy-L-arabinose transferase-like glycosyltransferase
MKFDRALLVLLAIIVPSKILLMLVGQRYVDGDEAVIGVMAMHIARGTEFPFYFWGQPYGGGGAFEAYMAAIPFSIFGPSSLGIRFYVLALSFASLILTFNLVRQLESQRAAILCTVLAATTSGLVEWFSKSRGGYVETSLFMLLILTLILHIHTSDTVKLWRPCLVGSICGLSYYVQEIALPFIALTGVALLFACARKRLVASLAAFLFAVAVAFSPVLAYNYARDWVNFNYILGSADLLTPSLARFDFALTQRLPFLFQPMNFDGFPAHLEWKTRAEAIVWVSLTVIAGIAAVERWLRGTRLGLIEATLAAYFFLFLPYVLLSQRADTSPRYYFTLFFPMIILSGMLLARGFDRAPTRWALPRLAAVGCGAFLIASGLWSHALAFRTNYVTDDVWTRTGGVESRRTNGEDLMRVIDYLRQNGVTTVRSPYFSAWRIIFESDEQILASSAGLVPGARRYPAFDRAVARSPRITWVLHCESRHNDPLAGVPHRRFGDFCVYL